MKRRKKGLIMGIAAIMAVALVFAGSQIYRYPAMFRNLSDRSLTDSQVAELREEIQREGTAEIVEFENLSVYDYRQQEIELKNQGQKIYGIAYIPETESERVPLVICAHGLGGSYQSNAAYAEQLASHGMAAYCFDFRGGGGSRGDGDTTEMSVMIEVSDLEVPDRFQFNWITAGRPYVEDMWDYDVYEEIGNYTGKVLLLHGSADGIVPLSYSDRAAEVYEDVEYYVIDGAGHGFHGGAFEEAVRYVFEYLQEI